MARAAKIAKLKRLLMQAKREGWSSWIKSEADEEAVLAGYVFSREHAEHACSFFPEYLRHSLDAWAGKPFELLPWQRDRIISPTFGWVHRETGRRRYRTVYAEIPKKNGKSTLAAGIGSYMWRGDGVQGAIVCTAATKKEQASLVHGEAVKMFRASPCLSKGVRFNDTTKSMTHEETNSVYRALASEGAGVEGINPNCIIIDELHVWKQRDFYDALYYAMIARKNPLRFVITTAGIYDPAGIGYQVHQEAMQLLKGERRDIETLIVIYAAPEACVKDGTWLDKRIHKIANPSYGTIISPDEMTKAAEEADQLPSRRASFLRYRLNQWIEPLEAAFDLVKWAACNDPVDETALRGRRCYAGLDLATKLDFTAWVLLFPPENEDEKWAILPRIFCPSETAAIRQRDDGIPYMDWAQQGALILTPGEVISYEIVREHIRQDYEVFDIRHIGADPHELEANRQELALTSNIEIHTFRQRWTDLTESYKQMEAMIIAGQFAHGDHPVLSFCIANSVRNHVGDKWIVIKPTGKRRIDAVVALAMAIGMSMVDAPAPEPFIGWV